MSEKPKLVRDWAKGYVRSNREIKNGLAEMPAGTVYFIESAGIKAHFISMPCDCCGIRMRFTVKGKNKFDDMEWLGYEEPLAN